MISRTTQSYSQIMSCRFHLQMGVVVSIDPSVGSRSSMPGYAVYSNGLLLDSGTFKLPVDAPLHERLRRLVYHVRKLYRKWNADVLVYEEIPAQRYGGGNASAHASLLKGVGAILSVSGPDHFVGLHPVSWKKLVRSTYVKGDREDAEEMGWVAIQAAAYIDKFEEVRKKQD